MASNYTDRSVDLVAWHGVKPRGWATLSQKLFNQDGKSEACTGIQRVVQRWIDIFLTPIGSVTFDKTKGTRFMLDVYTMCTENDVDDLFYICNANAMGQIRHNEDGLKEDEKIKTVSLDNIELFLGNLSIYVTITTMAGESTQIILPIDTNPMAL